MSAKLVHREFTPKNKGKKGEKKKNRITLIPHTEIKKKKNLK